MSDRKTILEWARDAKRCAEAGDCDPMPRDASFIRAAVTFNMLTRGPYPFMQVHTERVRMNEIGIKTPPQIVDDVFTRASAIVMIAINIDDHDQPSTPERARLFAEVLDA